MDENEDVKPNEVEDLTQSEQGIEKDDGVSGEEAHRIGEFDDLRDRLDVITGTLGAIVDMLTAMRSTADAVAVDNGAEVIDADGDGDADVIEDDVDVIPDYSDMDLDL